MLFNAANISPIQSVFNPDGSFTTVDGLGLEVVNPLAQIENTFNETNVSRLSGKGGLNYKVTDKLSVETSLQFNYSEVGNRTFQPIVNYGAGKVFNNLDQAALTVSKDIFRDYTFDAFATYKNQVDKHDYTAVLGTSYFQTSGIFSGGFFGRFDTDVDFNTADINNAAVVNNGLRDAGLSGKFETRLASLFTRLQYAYDSKYLVSYVLRRDGSSNFGPNNRFGWFQAGSLGWVISQEDFFAEQGLLTFLKLRASYGVIGNDRIRANSFTSVLDGEATYVSGNQLQFGRAVGILPNPEVGWEEQETLNIGVDGNLLDNKLSFTADYFIRTTDGLLLQPQVSGILGANAPGAQPPFINSGSIRNSGLELSLGFRNDPTAEFTVNVNANATFLNNEVLKLGAGRDFIAAGQFGVGQEPPSRMEVGQPIGFFYGYETDGIFQNQGEVDAHASQTNAAPGDLRYIDQNDDGVIDEDDRVNIGDPIPDVTFGLNINLGYKDFDFAANAFASVGNDMVRNYERAVPGVNQSVYNIGRWTGEGSTNTTPRVTDGVNSNFLFSDYYVEDASFLRIQNIQLGYTLPQKVLDSFGAKSLRVYTSINNPFTFTSYRGFDPSATTGDPIGGGIDPGFYPVPRTYLLGLNVKF